MVQQNDDAVLGGLAEAKVHANLKSTSLDDKHSVTSASTGGLKPSPDDPNAGLIPPTDEEKKTLRRVHGKLNWNTYLIAYVELAERFSYYGATVVFTNFIQQPLPNGSSTGAGGADGQSEFCQKNIYVFGNIELIMINIFLKAALSEWVNVPPLV